MITKELVLNRIENFWGYGNLRGKHWFIGMEEGHDLDMNALEKRFIKTANRSVVDIVNGNPMTQHLRWFNPPRPPIQNTYKGYIAIKLFLELGRMPDKEEIRNFQLHKLGREFIRGESNDHAILELMPLPNPGISQWIYGNLGIGSLYTRKMYLEIYKPARIKRLMNLIKEHEPQLVVFYSTSYLEDWRKIASCDLTEVQKDQYMGVNGKTLFCVLLHPTAHGISNYDWECWGREIYNSLLK